MGKPSCCKAPFFVGTVFQPMNQVVLVTSDLKFALESSTRTKLTLCVPRKYPDPYHGGNWKFRRSGGVDGPGNSEGERAFEAKFTSRWLGKLLIFREFVLTP